MVAFPEDPTGALRRLRGDPLSTSPADSWLGARAAGEKVTVVVSVKNWAAQEIRLLGIRSCACSVANEFPIRIPPHGAVDVKLETRFPARAGDFAGRFEFFTDDKSQPLVVGRFAGRAVMD
jgi:hypothetical protein